VPRIRGSRGVVRPVKLGRESRGNTSGGGGGGGGGVCWNCKEKKGEVSSNWGNSKKGGNREERKNKSGIRTLKTPKELGWGSPTTGGSPFAVIVDLGTKKARGRCYVEC